jgi:exportin-2 (importin alpha re-exporter)
VQIAAGDKTQIKGQLVPIMISLGTPGTAKLQSQISEALSTIATLDFPEEWEGLIDVSYCCHDNRWRTLMIFVGIGQ